MPKTPCLKNACQGGYGECLDVKLTNRCMARCEFCIEKDGYAPETEVSGACMAYTANQLHDYQTVLILGGEPMMSMDRLVAFLSGIRPMKRKIYMTTNGLLLNQATGRQIGPYLDGVNISLHSYNADENDRILNITGREKTDWAAIQEGIAALHAANCTVRINTNLVKSGLCSKYRVQRMCTEMAKLGADWIRFTELQDVDDTLFVDAARIFPELKSIDPYCDGCEQEIEGYPLRVTAKLTCGRVNKRRPMPDCPDAPISQCHTKVLYPDGIVRNGWLRKSPEPTSPFTLCDDCHAAIIHEARTAQYRRIQEMDALYGLSGGCHCIDIGH